MNYSADVHLIKQEATKLLQQGEAVTAPKIAATLGIKADESITAALEMWWLDIESLAAFISPAHKNSNMLTISDGLNQSLLTLWQDAVKEAKTQLLEIENKNNNRSDTLEDNNETFILATKLNALQNSYQILTDRYKQQETKFPSMEAEKLDLQKELKKAGKTKKLLDDKLVAANKTIEQLKRDIELDKINLEQRIKQEVQRYQELGQKLENKLSYYQNELKQTKENWSQEEATLKGQIKGLQTQQSLDKKVIDSQKRQLVSQEQQMQIFREETNKVASSLLGSGSQTLNSKNKIKRLESDLQEKEPYIKELKQRIVMRKYEASKRENELKTILREKEAEINLMNTKHKELQRTLIARDEEVRRLRETI